MRIRIVSVTFLILGTLSGWSYSQDVETEAIQLLHEKHHQALSSGKVEDYVSCFTDDAILMPPGEGGRTGKEAIRAWGKVVLDTFQLQVSNTATEKVQISGDWAFTRSSYVTKLTNKESNETVRGENKSIHIYRREPDGSWKIAYCMWSDNGVLTYSQ